VKIEPSGGFCGRILNVLYKKKKKDNLVSFGIMLGEVNGGWRLPGKEMCRGKK